MAKSAVQGRLVGRGAVELRAFLKKTKQSISGFCAAQRLDRMRIQRFLSGERHRVSVDLAWLIEVATDGAVPWTSWISAATLKRTRAKQSVAARTGTDG